MGAEVLNYILYTLNSILYIVFNGGAIPALLVVVAVFTLLFVIGVSHIRRAYARNDKKLSEKLSEISELNDELTKLNEELTKLNRFSEAMSHDTRDIFTLNVKRQISTAIKINGAMLPADKRVERPYYGTWQYYANKHVHPDDREALLKAIEIDNVLEGIRQDEKHTHTYRIIHDGKTPYYMVTFASDGKNMDDIVFGIRYVDEIVRHELDQKSALLENSAILAKTGNGLWRIKLCDNGGNKMYANETLQKTLGTEDMNLSPEELYTYYHSRLKDNVSEIERDDYQDMSNGNFRSRSLTWDHPVKGPIYLLAGGTSFVQEDGETVITGYSTDITVQKRNENRAGLIIGSLASTYEGIIYIKLNQGTFLKTGQKSLSYEDLEYEPFDGNVYKAIDYTCRTKVAPEFMDKMVDFSDLTTINERMRYRHIIIEQFKTFQGIWHEWSFIVADRNPDGTIKHLIWTVRVIEDEKQAEIRKQQIIDDNIAANKAKTKFLQNMSHEIRTPLNAIVGFSQILAATGFELSTDEKAEYARVISNNSELLTMLLDDILDISDDEHGNYRVVISNCNCNEICRRAISTAEYRALAGVRMYFTTDVPDDLFIKTDGRRIQQVLVNYLTNSCKHTNEGEIHLHCSSSEYPGYLTFSVTDTGTGVPEDKQDIIFERFTKLDQFTQGSGLGLNICRTVADKLGGEVFLDKEYTGGARFVFKIANR